MDHVLDAGSARALCDLTTRLTMASDAPEMALAIAETAHQVAGAAYAQLGLPSETGHALVLYHGPALDQRAQDEWPIVPLEVHTPVGRVLGTGEPLAFQSADELVEQFPIIKAASDASGYESLVVVPVLDPLQQDLCAGTLSFAWVERDRATDRAIEIMIDVAARCALGLANVKRAGSQSHRAKDDRRAALALQRSLLPSLLVDHPRLEFSSRYLASTDELVVGGDWYDTVPLPDGRVALAVGDVAGHGFDAALAMGKIRHDFEALAAHHRSPSDLLEVLDQLVEDRDAPMTTVAVVHVDPECSRVTHALAGHPPPILVRGGVGRLLDQSVGTPLGVGLSGSNWPAATTTRVDPGDTLVLYTDGLVERRDESIGCGIERLRELVESAVGSGPADFCDLAVRTMLDGHEPRDDIALLAVTIT